MLACLALDRIVTFVDSQTLSRKLLICKICIIFIFMSDNKRKAIFDLYVTNLRMLREAGFFPNMKTQNMTPYLCPICLDEFTDEHLDTKLENHLTLEDAPPKSLGGKANILTCKKCNNTAGHEIDAHLANRLKELDKTKFFRNTEAKVKVEKDGIRVNGTMTIKNDGEIQMYHSEKNNNPEVLKKYIQSVKGGDVITSYFMPSKVNDDRLKIALLKTGYLLLFQKYGYSLILTNEYDRVREQLQNPDKLIYPLDFWFLGPFSLELTKNVPFVIEKGHECALPFFVLTTGKSSYVFATILPVNNRAIEDTIDAYKGKFDLADELALDMYKFGDDTDFLLNMGNVVELLIFINGLQVK